MGKIHEDKLLNYLKDKHYLSDSQIKRIIQAKVGYLKDGRNQTIRDILVELRMVPEPVIRKAEESIEELEEVIPDGVAIDGYEISGTIGRGAMGVVYLAEQLSLGRSVALKVLSVRFGHDEDFIRRFVREARATGRLNHPNIVQAFDAGESNGHYYLAMEFVSGPPLDRVISERGMLAEKEALDITLQVVLGLEEAHENGLVHRDVKPENIFITTRGVAKLGDLGLAKSSAEEDYDPGEEGVLMGTPFYMSPEQTRGEKDIDIRSDMYALGITLYHMVTGSVPFMGSSIAVTLAKHLSEELPSPRKFNPALSDGMCCLLRKMLEKDRERRHQTPEELIEDIEALLRGEEPDRLAPYKESVLTDTKSKTDFRFKYSKIVSDDDVLFGLIATKGRLLSPQDLKHCLDIQEQAAGWGAEVSLPNLLMEKGYLSRGQVKAVLRALMGHREELARNSFGQIAVAKGYATREAVETAIKIQAREGESGRRKILGTIMQEEGFIAGEQKLDILQTQESTRRVKDNVSFGRIVQVLKFATKKQVDECTAEQARSKERGELRMLPDIMVEKGYIQPREKDVIIRAQKRVLLTGQSLVDLILEQHVGTSAISRIPKREEPIFTDADLVVNTEADVFCPACGKGNPPGSGKCAYCGVKY